MEGLRLMKSYKGKLLVRMQCRERSIERCCQASDTKPRFQQNSRIY